MGRHAFFTTDQLATRFGIPRRLIEVYAEKGLLFPVTLHDGVFFTPSAFIRLEVIEKGKRLGFSLAEIKRVMDGVRRPD